VKRSGFKPGFVSLVDEESRESVERRCDRHRGGESLTTGPPTQCRGQYCFACCASVVGCRRRSSASVTPRRNVTHQVAACGRPVVLRPVRATFCLNLSKF